MNSRLTSVQTTDGTSVQTDAPVSLKPSLSLSLSLSSSEENYVPTSGTTPTPRKRFTAPTPEEVRAYGREIGFDIDAEKFCDHYAAKGWVVGKSPMKDWKAAVRTWRAGQQSTPVNGYRKPPDPLGPIEHGPVVLPKEAAPRPPKEYSEPDPILWGSLK